MRPRVLRLLLVFNAAMGAAYVAAGIAMLRSIVWGKHAASVASTASRGTRRGSGC